MTRYRVTKMQTNHSFLNTLSNTFILLPNNSSKKFFLQVFQFKYFRKVYNVCYTPVRLVPFYFVTQVIFSNTTYEALRSFIHSLGTSLPVGQNTTSSSMTSRTIHVCY